MSITVTPYDNPRGLIQRLTFPKMRNAFLLGVDFGKWESAVDAELKRLGKKWPPPIQVDERAFYRPGRNPKDLDPEDVPPIERMPPECYEYSRNWGW